MRSEARDGWVGSQGDYAPRLRYAWINLADGGANPTAAHPFQCGDQEK